MIEGRLSLRALLSAVSGSLALCAISSASATESRIGTDSDAPPVASPAPEPPRASLDSSPGNAPPTPPLVSRLDFEAAAYLSVSFAERAVADEGWLNPVGGGAYAAIRYVPTQFPFHAFFETGGGLFATGATSGPSGTEYHHMLWALFFLPGVGLDLGKLRISAGLGPALAFTTHASEDERSATTSLAVAGDLGISYRFFENTPWATSASLRYQTVPGAKIEALCLGVQVRFGSIGYR